MKVWVCCPDFPIGIYLTHPPSAASSLVPEALVSGIKMYSHCVFKGWSVPVSLSPRTRSCRRGRTGSNHTPVAFLRAEVFLRPSLASGQNHTRTLLAIIEDMLGCCWRLGQAEAALLAGLLNKSWSQGPSEGWGCFWVREWSRVLKAVHVYLRNVRDSKGGLEDTVMKAKLTGKGRGGEGSVIVINRQATRSWQKATLIHQTSTSEISLCIRIIGRILLKFTCWFGRSWVGTELLHFGLAPRWSKDSSMQEWCWHASTTFCFVLFCLNSQKV